jgi:hypothetical protein
MTAQLGNARAQLRCKQAQQVLDADLFKMSLTVPLAVEASKVPGGRVLPKKQTVARGELNEQGRQPRIAMDVLMRIEMRGGTTQRRLKTLQLGLKLRGAPAAVVKVYQWRGVLGGERDVKPDSQSRLLRGLLNGVDRRRPIDHQAGAGQHSALVELHNRAIDAATGTEIVSVYNQVFHRRYEHLYGRTLRWCFRRRAVKETSLGPCALPGAQVRDAAMQMFVDMGTHRRWLSEATQCKLRVLVDGEPGFT